MSQRIWGSGPISLLGYIFLLGLLILLFIYLPGMVVSAAVPGSAGDGTSPSNRGQGAASENLLELEELVISTLDMNTTARWSIYLGGPKVYLPVILHNYFAGEDRLEPEELVISTPATNTTANTITLSVAPGSMVDIVLSVIGEDGSVLVDNQNLSPAGEVETITNLSLQKEEKYEVLISTAQGEGTDYALMLLDQDSYTLVLQGTFFENGSRTASLAADTDHFWFFNARSGDRLTFTVTPELDGDVYVELYNPAAELILILDENLEGESETLENFILKDSGLYGIRIGEFDFLPMDYQISVSK